MRSLRSASRCRLAIPALLAGSLAAPVPASDPIADSIAERVVERVQRARRDAGASALERRPELDAAALARARRLAAAPHSRRLRDARSVEDDLRAAGVDRFAAARSRIEMTSGSDAPGDDLAASWAAAGRAWRDALDPRRDAIGAAHVRAADGWDVFVALLVDDAPPPPDPAELRSKALAAVNEERRRRGLPLLREDPRLSAVARDHSRAMAVEGFFDHRAPSGSTPGERVRRAGIEFHNVAENIQRNGGYADPVGQAVRSWLDSPPHRRAMLGRSFSVTGMGVWVDDGGEVFFTQLFLEPRGRN